MAYRESLIFKNKTKKATSPTFPYLWSLLRFSMLQFHIHMVSGNFFFLLVILLMYSKLFENRMFLMHFFFIVSIHSHTAVYSAIQDWNWFYTQIKTRKSKALTRTVHVFRVVFILRELCPSSSLYIFEKKSYFIWENFMFCHLFFKSTSLRIFWDGP